MGTYGRNFEFRIPPQTENRGGRFASPVAALSGSGAGGGTAGLGLIPIGAPVEVDYAAGNSLLGLQIVKLATGATAPVGGQMGVAVYEWGPAAFAGDDPNLVTYSDKDYVPAGRAVQVVSGPYVKVVFTNTVPGSFLAQRSYKGRIMVAGLGATPSVNPGDFLSPGTGDDNDGYWAKTGTAANAWMVVTSVSGSRQEVEARMLF